MVSVSDAIRDRAEEVARIAQERIDDAPIWTGSDGVLPFDEGNLKDSQFVGPIVDDGGTVSFETGFIALHARFLENLRVIRPTRAQALSWVGSDGVRVFTQQVDNFRHYRWFSERWMPWAEKLVRDID